MNESYLTLTVEQCDAQLKLVGVRLTTRIMPFHMLHRTIAGGVVMETVCRCDEFIGQVGVSLARA